MADVSSNSPPSDDLGWQHHFSLMWCVKAHEHTGQDSHGTDGQAKTHKDGGTNQHGFKTSAQMNMDMHEYGTMQGTMHTDSSFIDPKMNGQPTDDTFHLPADLEASDILDRMLMLPNDFQHFVRRVYSEATLRALCPPNTQPPRALQRLTEIYIPPRRYVDKKRRKTVCLDWLKGKCDEKRWKCKFAHPSLPDLPVTERPVASRLESKVARPQPSTMKPKPIKLPPLIFPNIPPKKEVCHPAMRPTYLRGRGFTLPFCTRTSLGGEGRYFAQHHATQRCVIACHARHMGHGTWDMEPILWGVNFSHLFWSRTMFQANN